MANGGKSSKVVDVISKFLTPTAWIAGIIGLIGLSGLAFNAFLSLLVGAQVANYSSTAEHFGAGATLLFPGLVYTIDIIAAVLYVVLVLILVWIVAVFVFRLLLLAFYGFLRLLSRDVRAVENRGIRPWVESARVDGLAKEMKDRTPLVLDWTQDMHNTARRAFRWTWKKFGWVFTFAFVVAAAGFLTVWIPYREAQRFRFELCEAAEQSLTPPKIELAVTSTEEPEPGVDTAALSGKLAEGEAGKPCDRLRRARPAGGETSAVAYYEPIGRGPYPFCWLKPPTNVASLSKPENREFKVPALSYLATAPRDWTKDFLPARWFGIGAHQLDCGVNWIQARIGVDALLSRPKLVAIEVGEKGKILRPMLSVADYGDAVVLYDFLFDGRSGDEYIDPLRALKRSNITNVTAIDPLGRVESGQLPVLAVLDTACGLNPFEELQDLQVIETDPPTVKDVKDRILAYCKFNGAPGGRFVESPKDCVKRQFLKADELQCRAVGLASLETKVATPSPDGDAQAQLIAAVNQMASRLLAVEGAIASLRPIVAGSGHEELAKQLGGVTATLANVNTQLNELVGSFREARLEELVPLVHSVSEGVARLEDEATTHAGAFAEARGELTVSLESIGESIRALQAKVEELGTAAGGHEGLAASLEEVLATLTKVTESLAGAEAVLREAVEKGINVTVRGGSVTTSDPPKPTSLIVPSVTRPPLEDALVFADPDESLIIASIEGCEPLTQWGSIGLEFENNRYRLGERNSDLVLTASASQRPWEQLLAIFALWSGEIEGARSRHAGDDIFLLLVGRASGNGDLGHNLDLSRDRAGEVERELLAFWNGEAPLPILAVGQGESSQAGEAARTALDSSNRRVDASVCAVTRGSEAAKAIAGPDAMTPSP